MNVPKNSRKAVYLGGNVGRLSLSPPTIYSAPLGNRGRLSQTLDTGRHCLHVISVQASRNWTRSLSTSQACGNLSVIRVATVQSTSPPGKRAPTSFSFAAARGGARTDDLLCTTGHGDTDLTFRKTANVLFFCTTVTQTGVYVRCSRMVQHRGWKKHGKLRSTRIQNHGT